MAQRKQLVSVGNSLAVLIEKPVLELLGIAREVEVTTKDGCLIIRPINDPLADARRLLAAAGDIKG